MSKQVKEILIKRDNISPEEAQEQIDLFKEDLENYVEGGASLEDLYDLMMSHFGLEPDYLDDFLFDLI